ncbi:helix-turn-helix domain-containing protein [Bacteroidota bacterium]
MDSLGCKIRTLREAKGLLIRQLASATEIDQALISKIERGERIATKNQILSIAEFLKVDKRELLTRWLGEKIAYEIKDEDIAGEALKVAEETIQYLRNPKGNLANV